MLVIMDESGYICLPQPRPQRVGEGFGANTGGMGAYAPASSNRFSQATGDQK